MSSPPTLSLRHSRLSAPSLPLAFVALTAVAAVLAAPSPALAYVGPGAGFALVSSFFVFFVTVLSALVSLLLFPLRLVLRGLLTRRGTRLARRVIVVGFDGQDPRITNRLMERGLLPAFAALAGRGAYRPLQTTTPPISPVAWSSFATGVQPGKHGIFDFVHRDPRRYAPELAGVWLGPPRRVLRLGRWHIPLSPPILRLTRGSRTFWSILGRHRIWSTILRVPVSFPPERFHGAQLAASGAPDLKGTQGTFTLVTSREASGTYENGDQLRLARVGDVWSAELSGPPSVFRPDRRLALPITVRPMADDVLEVAIGGQRATLRQGQSSEWLRLIFRDTWPVRINALVRITALEAGSEVALYLSPLHLDPAKPAMPLSWPRYFSAYLEKRIGPFATLGLAEDTSSFNDGIVDEPTFLEHVRAIDRERARMLMASLDRVSDGTVVCVLDATDRVQHMCWGDGDHDAASEAIVRQYQDNDALLGQVVARLTPDDLLLVLSDHGFTGFGRSVGLNRWLEEHGYLARTGLDDGQWLQAIDWSRTRAYAIGLAGIYINLAGRERHGIVEAGEAPALLAEIRAGLLAIDDPVRDQAPIRRILTSAEATPGPYTHRAPDLFVGYAHGYRVSWDSARGAIDQSVLADNTARWSGDHCVDPELVPGVLFCNRQLAAPAPSLLDVAPTILHAFGVEIPAHMDGRSLFAASESVA